MCARILLIDDKATNRALLRTILTQAGHTVEEAADGVEGLACVRARAYDLVVSDMVMPRMNGYEFVTAVRADPALTTLLVIFCSAIYPFENVVHLAHICRVQAVISLAMSPSDILNTCDRVLGGQAPLLPLDQPLPPEQLSDIIADLKNLVASLKP